MVLAERNTELVRNGRRSRGPSPNNGVTSSGGGTNVTSNNVGGAGTPDTSSDDDNFKKNGKNKAKQSEYEEKIRVGRDYQAVCPPLVPEHERKPEILNDKALLVWSPTKDIPDSKLEEYISVAKEKYGYNGEQALGMLFWHKHDLERAVMDLSNFTPFPDEWTVEDKVLFEQAFQFHGKSFHRIRQMLPDKSIASLVKYYYSWKKTRQRQSVMDRQEKIKAKDGSENGSENGSNEESDNDDKDQATASTSGGSADQNNKSNKANSDNVVANEIDAVNEQRQKKLNDSGRATPVNVTGHCSNCGVACYVLHPSPQGKLCGSCHHHWRRTGNMRPTAGPFMGKRSRERSNDRRKRKPPKGVYINHDDIVALASGNEDSVISSAENRIIAILTQNQLNKQQLSYKKQGIFTDPIEEIRPSETTAVRVNSRWSNEELMLAVQGVRKYGKDFQAIAEIIGTKNEAHVRQFYMNYRRRYNLDQVLKEYEADKEAQASSAEASKDSQQNKKQDDSTPSVTNKTAKQRNTAADGDNTLNDKVQPIGSENIIMEIDLDEQSGDSQPPSKRFALSFDSSDSPKATSAV